MIIRVISILKVSTNSVLHLWLSLVPSFYVIYWLEKILLQQLSHLSICWRGDIISALAFKIFIEFFTWFFLPFFYILVGTSRYLIEEIAFAFVLYVTHWVTHFSWVRVKCNNTAHMLFNCSGDYLLSRIVRKNNSLLTLVAILLDVYRCNDLKLWGTMAWQTLITTVISTFCSFHSPRYRFFFTDHTFYWPDQQLISLY